MKSGTTSSIAPPATPPNLTAEAMRILREGVEAVEAHVREFITRACKHAPPRLVESIEYSVFAGGKRLRPALVMESFRACSGSEDGGSRMEDGAKPSAPSSILDPASSSLRSALSAAAAMELIHTFSLVHDDLPAMDDDDLRRGRPTNHKVFGEAMAILAGDAMTTLAFEVIATDAEPDLVPALIRELSHAAGPCGMIGGQVLDIDGEGQSLSLEGLQKIHRMKTGALLTASCRLGAIAARADQTKLEAITSYGRHLGLAFQIIDDVLDVTSTPEQLGKHTRKDANRGKNTYPSLLGLEESRAEAHRQLNQSLSCLNPLGPAAGGLAALARFVVERSN